MEIQKFFASCSLYKSDVLNRRLIGSLNNHTRMHSLIILRSMSFCGHLLTQEPTSNDSRTGGGKRRQASPSNY